MNGDFVFGTLQNRVNRGLGVVFILEQSVHFLFENPHGSFYFGTYFLM